MSGSIHDNEFKRALAEKASANIIADFWYFLRTGGKWWLAPVIALLLMLGGLMLLSSTAAAPFIYTLF